MVPLRTTGRLKALLGAPGVKGFHYTTGILTYPALAPLATRLTATIPIERDAYFLVTSCHAVGGATGTGEISTGGALGLQVQPRDSAQDALWTDGFVDESVLFGQTTAPHYLLHPILLYPGSLVTVETTNNLALGAGGLTRSYILGGAKLPPRLVTDELREYFRRRRFFIYTVTLTKPAGATGDFSGLRTIDEDADFIAWKLVGGITTSQLRAIVLDVPSSESRFSAFTGIPYLDVWNGYAPSPGGFLPPTTSYGAIPLPSPIRLRKREAFRVTERAFGAAAATDRFHLEGVKLLDGLTDTA